MDAPESAVRETDCLLADGVEIFVGGCNLEGRPCICRALAAERTDPRHIVVVLSRTDAAEVARAIRDTHRVAVLVAVPQAMRSHQIQDSEARRLRCDARWEALVERRRGASSPCVATAVGAPRPSASLRARQLVAFRCRTEAPLSATCPAVTDTRDPRPRRAEVAEPTPPAIPVGLMTLHVRHLLETGCRPALCTVSNDGMPHISRAVSATYVDERHVAVSFGADDTARRNLLERVRVALCLGEPDTDADLSMQAIYLNSVSSGPVWDRVQARATVAAWRLGAADLCVVHGADILTVEALNQAPGSDSPSVPHARRPLPGTVRRVSDRLCFCRRLDELLSETTVGLAEHLGLARTAVWSLDAPRRCLELLVSHGYRMSGADAAVPLGIGPVGIAALAGLPVRTDHVPYVASATKVPESAGERTRSPVLQARGVMSRLDPACPCAQLALPLRVRGRVIGVLVVGAQHDRHFDAEDEDALVPLAAQLATSLAMLRLQADGIGDEAPCRKTTTRAEPIDVRYHAHDSSVFLDAEYLIRGVAGALFWKIARIYVECGRCEFTTRELHRCAVELRLPPIHDNLYTRLLLLQRRLAERAAPVQIDRTGRGRFRVSVSVPLRLRLADVLEPEWDRFG